MQAEAVGCALHSFSQKSDRAWSVLPEKTNLIRPTSLTTFFKTEKGVIIFKRLKSRYLCSSTYPQNRTPRLLLNKFD